MRPVIWVDQSWPTKWTQIINLTFLSQSKLSKIAGNFFAQSQIIWRSPLPIFTIFAPYADDQPAFFSRHLMERCHSNQFCGKIAFRNVNVCINSGYDAFTSCKNFVNQIWSTNSRVDRIFGMTRQKLHWRIQQTSQNILDDCSVNFRIGEHRDDDYKSNIYFALPWGTCYGNQLIFGESNECWLILPAFFALAFQNKLQYRYLNARFISRDNGAPLSLLIKCVFR